MAVIASTFGTYFPKMTYGFSIGLGWKGFDLNLFLQGAGQVKGLVRDVVLGQLLDQTGKPTSIFTDHWTPENPNAKFPRLWNSYTQNDPDYNISSFWVRNAGYMRLKNLQVGYTSLPDGLRKWVFKNPGYIIAVRIFLLPPNFITGLILKHPPVNQGPLIHR